MLLGAQNAWAATYKVHHNGMLHGTPGTWEDSEEMVAVNDGYCSVTFKNVPASKNVIFSIKKDGTWQDANSSWIDGSKTTGTTLYYHNDSKALTFTTPSAESTVIICFKEWTCYVKVITSTHTLDLSWNTSLKCYVYDEYKNEYNGAWNAETAGTSFSSSDILDGVDVRVILHDASGQAYPIDFGAVTGDISRSFSINTGDKYAFDAMSGDFNSDRNDYGFDKNSTAIVPLTIGDHQIRFGHYYNESGDKSIMAGSGAAAMTEPGALNLYSDNATKYTLTADVTGDYVFVYKSWSGVTVTLDVYYPGGTYTRTGMEADKWGTICVPYAVTSANRSGAEFYTIAGKNLAENPTILYLAPVGDADLVAGQPYFFKATGDDNLVLTYSTTAAQPGSHNGLIGSYKGCDVAAGLYLLSNNVIVKAGTGCSINENKAYIDMSKVTVGGAGAPGVREIPLAPQGPTDIKSVGANKTAVKFIQDGKLFIQKNGVVYDMTGRVVR